MQTSIRIASCLVGLAASIGTAGARALDASHARACAQVAATVVAASTAESRDACAAIVRAAAFLAEQGIAVLAPIELHLVDALPPELASPSRVGAYLHEHRRAYVLRRDRWPANSAPFGLPMTRTVHRSAIVHEAVHAIFAQHYGSSQPDVVAHEYLAYVGQLASLPPRLRARALHGVGPSDDDSVRRLNLFVLGMNPDRFAALAWRHWSAPGRGALFVHALLEDGSLPQG
ncbi:MAG TPA: DUF6639 family protein [Zeimonas sp.]